MGSPLHTDIVGICKSCGAPLTESAYGTGYWDFRIQRDPHACPELPTPSPNQDSEDVDGLT
jgi:hypothetical protein